MMKVSLARQTLVYEWRRYLPSVLAIGFTGLLELLQMALVYGIFGSVAVYLNGSDADIWVAYPGTQSVDLGRPINPDIEMLLRMDPEVTQVEPFLWVDGDWRGARDTGGVSVYVSGINVRRQGLVFAKVLPASLRARLAEPDAVVVDRAELDKLGVRVGDHAVINGHRVSVVGVTSGLRALGGVNVIASLSTARRLNGDADDSRRPTYLVARLRDPTQAAAVAARLNGHAGFGPYHAWTANAFARRSVTYWLFETGAGAGVLFMACIVLLVGAVITSQTLKAAVFSSVREYATLNALGVGMSALRFVVLEQALWIGGLGLIMALLLGNLLLLLAQSQDVPMSLNFSIMLTCLLLMLGLAAISGVAAMRGLHHADPATLLR